MPGPCTWSGPRPSLSVALQCIEGSCGDDSIWLDWDAGLQMWTNGDVGNGGTSVYWDTNDEAYHIGFYDGSGNLVGGGPLVFGCNPMTGAGASVGPDANGCKYDVIVKEIRKATAE